MVKFLMLLVCNLKLQNFKPETAKRLSQNLSPEI